MFGSSAAFFGTGEGRSSQSTLGAFFDDGLPTTWPSGSALTALFFVELATSESDERLAIFTGAALSAPTVGGGVSSRNPSWRTFVRMLTRESASRGSRRPGDGEGEGDDDAPCLREDLKSKVTSASPGAKNGDRTFSLEAV